MCARLKEQEARGAYITQERIQNSSSGRPTSACCEVIWKSFPGKLLPATSILTKWVREALPCLYQRNSSCQKSFALNKLALTEMRLSNLRLVPVASWLLDTLLSPWLIKHPVYNMIQWLRILFGLSVDLAWLSYKGTWWNLVHEIAAYSFVMNCAQVWHWVTHISLNNGHYIFWALT